MERRTDALIEYLEPFFEERFLSSCKEIQADFSRYSHEILTKLDKAISEVLAQAAKQQEEGEKAPAQYLSFCFLRSALFSDIDAFRIDVYDKHYYCDLVDTHSCWTPEFLSQRFLTDLDFFKAKAEQKFLRLIQYELDEIKKQYAHYYASVAMKLLEDQIERIIRLPKFISLRKGEEFTITFGGYMEKGVALWPA